MDIIELPSGVEVKYHLPFMPHVKQQDAIFYTGMNCIATVTCAGYAVDVYCDGETRANLLDAPRDAGGQVVSTLYSPSDFIDAGIDTDDALILANQQDLLDWVNNSWFDLYCYGEHLDAVSHELKEALAMAINFVIGERNAEISIDEALDNID